MMLLLLAACLSPNMSVMAADLPASEVRGFTARILDARARAKDVWPGFDLARAPLLINFPGTGTVLLDDAGPPAGFVRVRSGLFFKPGRFDQTSARFDADVPLGGRSAFFFRHDANAGDRSEILLLVHEAFHKFQGIGRPAAEQRALTPDEVGRIAYASHIENIALFQALASPDRFLDEARTFVALRRKRLAVMDRSHAEALLELETREGCAEYVAQRTALKTPLEASAAAAFLTPALAGALFGFADLDADATQRLDASVYGSGPAQMLILDRLRTPWKDRVAHGETIFAVMLDAISTDDEASRTKRAYSLWGDDGLERALRAPRKDAANAPDELWASFTRAPQPRILLKIWDAKVSSGLTFTGSRPIMGPERSWLYAGIEEASLPVMDGVSATFRRTSVRSGSGREQKRVGRMDQYPVEVEALLPEPALWRLRMDGKPFSLGATKKAFRTLEWTSPHVDLVISRPGSITQTDGRVLVEIDPPHAH
jgi:hypothetical protein